MADQGSGRSRPPDVARDDARTWRWATLRQAWDGVARHFPQRPTLVMPLAVAAIGLLATSLAALEVSHAAREKDIERFEHVVAQAQDSIDARLQTYIAMLRAGVGLLEANDGVVDREAFRAFVEQLELDEHYPGIQGIGFSARLPGGDVAAAERALRFHDASGVRIYPTRRRAEYHAIVHLEPLDRRNEAALGYDMYSEPVRQAAMSRARDTGQPAASGRVELVQEIDEVKQAGFLIYLPVYSGDGAPHDLSERRTRLQGFVYSPFRADDLMAGIFGTAPRPRLRFEIYDGAPLPENALHTSPGPRSERPRYVTTRQLNVAGRPWTIVYETRPEFDLSSASVFVPWAFMGGLLATALLSFLAWRQARAKENADRAAGDANASARRLQILNASAARLSAELDRDQLLQSITDAGRELSGAEIGAFFYSVRNGAGEAYVLFALSGAPREAFEALGMPRNTAVFGPTFRGEGVVRSADITADPRFGKNAPHRGFPAGHWPVRSYLALPVRSRSGEVLGGLFFGHSQIGMFDDAAEQALTALAGHAAITLDNAALFKAAQDEIVTRKEAEEHQKLLLDELNHRVKNTLATVQSIAAQTLRTSPTPAAFQSAFEKRLIALSETHNLLARSKWRGVDLRELLERELIPHGLEDSERITLQGEAVWLPASTALALGLIVHELATNAARHGSLSTPDGNVTVTWTAAPDDNGAQLRLVWKETGGPPVCEPRRRGFGSRLIERGLANDPGGQANLSFEPSGLRCELEARLPERGGTRLEFAAAG